MTDEIDYSELDPGIVDTVRLVRANGFETTDSGDGVTKLQPGSKYNEREVERYPHVYCVVAPRLLLSETDRLRELLGPEWRVEGSYLAGDTQAAVMATRVTLAQLMADFFKDNADA